LERYFSSFQPILIVPELSVKPSLPKESNVRFANIKKVLVDLELIRIYGKG
jgi:hypothetical protein